MVEQSRAFARAELFTAELLRENGYGVELAERLVVSTLAELAGRRT